jgi:2-amino-4-hydroxy-6-hydroxymethyldihydropteridine diphosphokinase
MPQGELFMARCLIGCGSNLGKRREQLDLALDLIRFMPGVELLAVSRYVETRPVGGPPGQGCYLNGACLLETDLEPHDLLGALMAVEHTLERRRDERWGERTVDLDILLYEDLVLDTPDLTLPHPRMATRRFVLEPSAEIAAELPYPPGACTVRDLLDNISVPHPLVAVVGVPGSGATEVAVAVADATLARLVRAAVPMPVSLGDDDQGGMRTNDDRWLAAARAWQQPLAVDRWQDDPHGTVTDYWLDAIPVVAAASLPPSGLPRFRQDFEKDFERIARQAMPPHVAILLEVSKSELRERLAFRRREAGRHSDVFSELPGGTAVATDDTQSIDSQAESLFELQKRLERRLRCPANRCPRAPKAVITIVADDLAAATEEATAAVEAMV